MVNLFSNCVEVVGISDHNPTNERAASLAQRSVVPDRVDDGTNWMYETHRTSRCP
jgi:hypothetical protein